MLRYLSFVNVFFNLSLFSIRMKTWCEGVNRTAAFIVLHSIGHMAHWDNNHLDDYLFTYGTGFMASGNGITQLLKGWHYEYGNSPLPYALETYEKLIIGDNSNKASDSEFAKKSVCKFLSN